MSNFLLFMMLYDYQNTPLHTAILHKHGWFVKMLVNQNPPLHIMDISGVRHSNLHKHGHSF